ncbi:polysaccharide deacetylase family protein [Paenibacillus sp. MER 99-2]|uniref:polysaccharide deacetylase family protein n=1 Tax=Paenibacillus sp. MER 99-2 TaxID=2939572 RepID=UPI0020404179|nr:polysaccharide deacetylase family protein [Paenibacillus sp. MER 99-2]MCM3175265.1 polysaccharide deacetylase family protein [Paenibacillus sp. MER 99-2]
MKWKKCLLVTLAVLTCLTTVYVYAVNHPSNALAHKACTSWDMVKREAFSLSHSEYNSIPALDTTTFQVEPGTASEVPVLMYHYIEPHMDAQKKQNKSMISLQDFEKNMKYLHDEGYHTITLEELEDYVNGRISLPSKSIVITFDDGYQNNYTLAYPVLKKYDFHASIFVIGSKIQDQPSVFDSSKDTFLSKPEIEAGSDVFEYNSHTYNLHHKGFIRCGQLVPAGLDTSLLNDDIQQMKQTGIDTPYIAYPFGYTSTQMIYYLQQNGYRMAFTVVQGMVKPGADLMRLPRLTVTTGTDLSTLLQSSSSRDAGSGSVTETNETN